MTRNRCVTFSSFTTAEFPMGSKSDIKVKFILILTEYPETDKQRHECTNKCGRNRWPLWQKPVIHREAEAVEYVGDRVQLEKPPLVWWNKVKRVDDRCQVKP